MQGGNFVISDTDRVPSVFAAFVLYFIALLGRELTSFLTSGVYFVLSFLFDNLSQGFADALASVIYYGVFILIPFGFYAQSHPGIGEYIRIKPLSGRSALLCALIAPVGVLFVTMLTLFWAMILQAAGGTMSESSITVPAGYAGRIGLVLTSALLPAVCEELLMRGCFLSAREEKGSTKAIVLSAAAFMALHGSIEGMPSEFISGLILGFVVVTTDSLFAGMIYHFVHNSVVLIINFSQPAAEEAVSINYYTSIGGLMGCLVTAGECLLAGIALVLLLKTLAKAYRDKNFGVEPTAGAEKTYSVYAVIACCIVFVLIEYALDLLSVSGVL